MKTTAHIFARPMFLAIKLLDKMTRNTYINYCTTSKHLEKYILLQNLI